MTISASNSLAIIYSKEVLTALLSKLKTPELQQLNALPLNLYLRIPEQQLTNLDNNV